MRFRSSLARLVYTGALLGMGAAACDSVLDIDKPVMRPDEGGAAGESSSSGGSKSGAGGTDITPQGGESGEAGTTPQGGTMPLVPEGGMGGEGGAPTPPECEEGAGQCAGDTAKTPQICKDGHWIANTDEAASGDCPMLCAAGKCTECDGDVKRCSVCQEGDATCSQRMPQTCTDGHWVDAKDPCQHYCANGECGAPPSCTTAAQMDSTCEGGVSCCRSVYVPGGSFDRNYDGIDPFTDTSFPADVSPFLLDKFEVTVGRMRRFLDAYDNFKKTLKAGDGKSPHITVDTGWSDAFTLPADAAAVRGVLSCTGNTYSDLQQAETHLAVNCIPFELAYAFCIWDGGRLPTETEWNFAASGGAEHRQYPWKAPAEGDSITDEYAYYYAPDHLLPTTVGSRAKGNARWGNSDMTGNVSEWTLDFYQEELPAECHDCLETMSSSMRVRRGGSYLFPPEVSVIPYRDPTQPDTVSTETGMRCARDL